MSTYSLLIQEEPEEFTSAFDYNSIFTYSNSTVTSSTAKKPEKTMEMIDNTDLKGRKDVLSDTLSLIALVFSYIAIFFTLPVSVWYCFKILPMWERIVIFRLGK